MASTDPEDASGTVDVIALADGRLLRIRSTTADDAELIRALYSDLPIDDRRRRFFGAFTPQIDWCRQWATVAERGGFGVVAIVVEDGTETVVAEAGYALRTDGDGELAITVAPGWRGWLGPYLLDVLVRHAARAGLRSLQAEVLLENGPMLALLKNRDPVSLGHDSGMVRLSIGTAGPTPDWPPLDRRPRVLVEVAGRRWSGETEAEAAGLSTAMCAGPGGRVRHGCPVLDGGSCPLADGADAIVMVLDGDDERSRQLVEAHRRRSPGTPLLVADRSMAEPFDEQCHAIIGDARQVVAQVLTLIGGPPDPGRPDREEGHAAGRA